MIKTVGSFGMLIGPSSILCLDETAAGAAGTDEKKSSSKNKKKAAVEKKAKGGVDAKTVGFGLKTSPLL